MSSIPWPAVGAISFPIVGGSLSGYISSLTGSYGDWYDSLKKPDWRPPRPAFPIVWTSLYGSMGYASYLVWKEGGGFNGAAQAPLTLYGAQLALNLAWSPIFFGKRSITGGMITIALLDGAVIGTTYMFYKVIPKAGYLMVPYLIWLTLATALNYKVWKDNPAITDAKSE